MADVAEFTKVVFKILKNPRIKFVVIPVSWILMPLGKLLFRIPFMQLTKVMFEIDDLVRQKKYDEARSIREKWLQKPKFSKSAELLCYKGNDLLFNIKDYSQALQIFEETIKINPHYNPIELYYGASSAAMLTGDFERAKKYYQTFMVWWNKFKNDPKLKDFIQKNYSEYKKYLENNLEIQSRDKS
jgi:tetratricopeptide (TPR) repeat protein